MRSAIEGFWDIVLALIGAIAFAILVVGLLALAFGCAVFGCTAAWRHWRRRRSRRAPPPPGEK